jgi:cell volume regulation protein A
MAFVLAFFLAGLILIAGFLSDLLFRRTNFPDILVMIFCGYLLGPLLKIIDPESLAPVTPLLASLALLIILFEGGLNLDLFKVLNEAPRAIVLAVSGMGASIIAAYFFAYYFLKWDLLSSLLLGTIIGGTSSSIVIPMIRRANVSEKVYTTLFLESVFTDAFVVVLGITLLQILKTPMAGENMFSTAAVQITGQFSTGIVIGAIVGVSWLRVLRNIRGKPYDDIMTLTIVLLFYSIVEFLGGNGAIFSLTFGLILGNGREICRMLKIQEPIEATEIMKKFEYQISFLLRTFFFVNLGLILSISNYMPFLYGLILTGLLLIGRYSAVALSSIKNPVLGGEKPIMAVMMPRGLAAAVMAQIVSTSGVENGMLYYDITIAVIIMSVILTSIGFYLVARKRS